MNRDRLYLTHSRDCIPKIEAYTAAGREGKRVSCPCRNY